MMIAEIEKYWKSISKAEKEMFAEEVSEFLSNVGYPTSMSIQKSVVEARLRRYERRYGEIKMPEHALDTCVNVREFLKIVEEHPGF
jgi:hypothetical protein